MKKLSSSALSVKFIKLETPRHFLLSGLWLGPDKPSRVFIFIHGLGGSIFSRHELFGSLVDSKTAVLTFNNRGSGLVNGLKKVKNGNSFYQGLGGVAHEIFTDCVDDIDGAVSLANLSGVKEIYLIGHSTGCQKSVYYLAKRPKSLVRGAVLLAPVSDYSALMKEVNISKYRRALATAKRLVARNNPHGLLPNLVWEGIIDAQRFLSLYTPDSSEEIFSYASDRFPSILRQVKKPLLVVLAGQDRYHDRPAIDLAAWFNQALSNRPAQIGIIDEVDHDFSPAFSALAKSIKRWATSQFFRKK